ncbi:hypothetical protein ACIRP7_40910 [Streptomyces sp. NPDC102270]|uniref:hypothetical protein n=1 Tax=Streptomyces sp. NPDC102270 TaxID=3366150 RepID=UPI0037FB6588
MTTSRVELRIRRLELDAATAPSRAALCAAVEAELAVGLGLAPASDADRGRAGRCTVPADAAVAALGRQVALAVMRELGVREPARPRPRAGERRP